MNTETLFFEKQRFNQWWVWLSLVLLNGLFLAGVYTQVLKGQQFGDKPMSNTGLLIAAGISLLCTLLFYIFRLETRIKRDGIYVRFFPIQLAFKHFKFDDINKLYVRQYRPVSEYGGWGLRVGFSGVGKAYNTSGNKGLQIEFKDHRKLLIGTNRPEELKNVINALGQLKE